MGTFEFEGERFLLVRYIFYRYDRDTEAMVLNELTNNHTGLFRVARDMSRPVFLGFLGVDAPPIHTKDIYCSGVEDLRPIVYKQSIRVIGNSLSHSSRIGLNDIVIGDISMQSKQI